jgi:predicted pyridoxine 5'-phosphate oxidase superfamily flavin-nucleotide-binding protein
MQKEFVYDITYTHKINGELKKMYKEFYQLKKEQEKGKKKK